METTSRPQLRFAPSPNGPLHLGHAYSVLRNLEIARNLGGTLLLRIDDIDQSRARKAHEETIIRQCQWLGLEVTEPLRRQSNHFSAYHAAIEKLSAMGLTYNAYASRKEIRQFVDAQEKPWPLDPDGAPLFPKITAFTQPSKTHESPTSIRLDMAKALAFLGPDRPKAYRIFDPTTGATAWMEIAPQQWGDIALSTKDMAASYHLAVVVDDDAQAITHCVRGLDLKPSTDVHTLLQHLLGLKKPLYHHHRLIKDATGRKLSKSDGDAHLGGFIAQNVSKDDLLRLCKSRL